jgi:DNA-binding LacI/PurR family transcriptional regulator
METPQRPRLQDVADRAGVSTASVSLVLSDRPGPSTVTRERVRAAAEELGYRPNQPARLLARRRTHLIGLVTDVRNAFHAELVEGIHEASAHLGYDVVLSPTARSETRAVETLVDFRCEALVLLGSALSASFLAEVARSHPVVSVGRRVRAEGVDVVRADERRGTALAVDHLAGLGHRRIAHIDGGADPVSRARREGYRAAMQSAGLRDEVDIVRGGHTESAGAVGGARLLGRGARPTAVLAFNDRVAVGVVDAALRTGLTVPEDVSLVGYDDSDLARMPHVALTSVSQEVSAMSRTAVEVAVDRLDGDGRGGRQVVLEPRLVVRSSTGPS